VNAWWKPNGCGGAPSSIELSRLRLFMACMPMAHLSGATSATKRLVPFRRSPLAYCEFGRAFAFKPNGKFIA